MHMRWRWIGMLCGLWATAAHAESIRKNLAKAADRLEDALRDSGRTHPACQAQAQTLLSSVDGIDALRPGDDPARFDAAVTGLTQAHTAMRAARCPDGLTRDVQRALSDLQQAQGDARRRAPPVPLPPPQPTVRIQFEGAEVTPSPQGMVVSVPTVIVTGMPGATFYVAWFWSAEGGTRSNWEAWPALTAQPSPFVWNNPYRPVLDGASLRRADSANTGRFVAHVGVFDMNARELSGIDLPFSAATLNLRPAGRGAIQAPPPPPPAPGPSPLPHPSTLPALGQPPPPPGAAIGAVPPGGRDCGLGLDDPGCSMSRGGGQPMDRATFEGMMTGLRANLSESARLTMVRDTLRTRYVTARQLSAVMDLFIGENNRLDAVIACAPHLVDPGNALALSSKFISTARQRDFNQVISSQR